MSLLAHLEDQTSPIGQFFARRFRNTASVILQADQQLRPLRTFRPAIGGPDYPYQLVGMAIDYRLRFYFALTPKEQLVAWHGAFSVSGDEQARALASFDGKPPPDDLFPYASEVTEQFFAGLDATLARLAPVGRKLTEADERELARFCFVLACFEVPIRDQARWRSGPLMVPRIKQSVAELLATPSEEVLDDLCCLSALFFARYSALLTRPAFPNPRFTGSEALGGVHGADGDLIVGSCLIDFKATISPFIKPLWLRQLLAHVLLDYEDAYHLEWVALYLVRQGKLLSWKLADLLPILTGQAEVSVPALRQELRTIIDKYQTLRAAS